MGMERIRVVKRSDPDVTVLVAWRCRSFLCRLRGLTFRRELPDGKGLLIEESRQSRWGASIHMLAVFFPLGVAWLNRERVVVDLRRADPWRFYIPRQPAQYILEGPVGMLESLVVGDQLDFVNVPQNTSHTH